MGLLQRILSVLDLREDDGGDDPVDRGTAARVEREPAEDVIDDEGSDHDSGTPPGNRSPATDADSDSDGDGDADPGAAGPDAAPSTGSLVDSEEGVESAGTAGSGGRTGDGDGDGNASPPGAGVVSEEHVDGPVEEVKGIGPAYAGRLEDAGVTTIGQLAVADAESLAAATDVSQKRIARWIERARAR
jgi:hypothetical protein